MIVVRQTDSGIIKGPADLASKTVGVKISTTGAEAARAIQGATVQEFQTAIEAIQALANKKVDAVISDNFTSYNIVLNQPSLGVAVVGDPFATENYGLAVRPDCADLLKSVDLGLAAVINDGTYTKIYRKYFGIDPTADFLAGHIGMATMPATAAATTAATQSATASPTLSIPTLAVVTVTPSLTKGVPPRATKAK